MVKLWLDLSQIADVSALVQIWLTCSLAIDPAVSVLPVCQGRIQGLMYERVAFH